MLRVIALLLAAFVVTPAFASPSAEALSQCISDNTTGKDRKDLARWMFVVMSAHPEMRSISDIAPGAIDNLSKITGSLITRLFTESCSNEVRAIMQSGETLAFQDAFKTLGQLAMQEIMTDRNVAASASTFEKYIDKNKIEALRR